MRLGKYLSELTKPELDYLYEICGLTEEEIAICEMARRNKTYIEISDKLLCCSRTVDRRIENIKNKIRKVGKWNG